jgi:hypothetical protein
MTRKTSHNSTYPKVAVQWLNQALCFYQSLCLVDSEVLRNRHLRVAAETLAKSRYAPFGQRPRATHVLSSVASRPSSNTLLSAILRSTFVDLRTAPSTRPLINFRRSSYSAKHAAVCCNPKRLFKHLNINDGKPSRGI